MAMFDPPAGFDDLLGDAADVPCSSTFQDLEVPGIGVVRARKPRPPAIANLAMAYNEKTPANERDGYLTGFVRQHVDAGEFERLTIMMIDPDLAADPIEQGARALATWGTARPYLAVVRLAVTGAFNWRMMRLTIGKAGHDPMALPSMHAVLDWVEDIVLESMVSDDHKADQARRDKFTDDLYRPEHPVKGKRGAKGKRTPPPGFSPEEVAAASKQAAAALRAG